MVNAHVAHAGDRQFQAAGEEERSYLEEVVARRTLVEAAEQINLMVEEVVEGAILSGTPVEVMEYEHSCVH
jgi:hypothetical protein